MINIKVGDLVIPNMKGLHPEEVVSWHKMDSMRTQRVMDKNDIGYIQTAGCGVRHPKGKFALVEGE